MDGSAFVTLYMKQPNSFDTCLSCQTVVQQEHRSDQSDDVDQNHSMNSKTGLAFNGEQCFSLSPFHFDSYLTCYDLLIMLYVVLLLL